jgi:hypothetical protein
VKQRFCPERLLSWEENIGVGARAAFEWHIQSSAHPEQAIKSLVGCNTHITIDKYY